MLRVIIFVCFNSILIQGRGSDSPGRLKCGSDERAQGTIREICIPG